jgi:hypothetical protein
VNWDATTQKGEFKKNVFFVKTTTGFDMFYRKIENEKIKVFENVLVTHNMYLR